MGKVYEVVSGSHARWNSETNSYDVLEPGDTFELKGKEKLNPIHEPFMRLTGVRKKDASDTTMTAAPES